MRKTIALLALTGLIATGLLVYSGCNTSVATTIDPAVLAKHQEERIVAEQPANPVGIIELMEQLVGDSANPELATSEPVEVALLGKLGTANSSTAVFDDGEALFHMIDPSYEPPAENEADAPSEESHEGADHAHAATEEVVASDASKSAHKEDCACPFCSSSKTTQPQAIVTFEDAAGEPLPISAKKLFELSGDEIVVVKGTAQLSVGQLLVTADTIYVRE